MEKPKIEDYFDNSDPRGISTSEYLAFYEDLRKLENLTHNIGGMKITEEEYKEAIKGITYPFSQTISKGHTVNADRRHILDFGEITVVDLNSGKSFSVAANEDINKIVQELFKIENKSIADYLKECDEHQKKDGRKDTEFPYSMEQSLYRSTFPHEDRVFNFDECNSDKKAGVKHNQNKLPIDTMLTIQFPKAVEAIAKTTLFGHNKYIETDQDWLNFKRVEGGSKTYADAAARHNMDKNSIDTDSGLPHIFHKVWNAMAELELWLEENK